MIQVNEIGLPMELNAVMADYLSIYITGHYPLLILTLDRLQYKNTPGGIKFLCYGVLRLLIG